MGVSNGWADYYDIINSWVELMLEISYKDCVPLLFCRACIRRNSSLQDQHIDDQANPSSRNNSSPVIEAMTKIDPVACLLLFCAIRSTQAAVCLNCDKDTSDGGTSVGGGFSGKIDA